MILWRRDKHRRRRFSEQPEEWMSHQRLLLIDRGADALCECGLCQRDCNAAVRDIARRVNQLSIGESPQQRVQIGLGIKIKVGRFAPHPAKNHLGKFRTPERGHLLRGRIR